MTDKSDKFWDIPAIRAMLADPRKTSRNMEDFYDRINKDPNFAPITDSIDKARISSEAYSGLISKAILNNQKEYDAMGSNIEDLSDTFENIGADIQSGMYDMISEMQGVAKQMKVKNALAKKKVEESQITNQHLESVDQGIYDLNMGVHQTNMSVENMKDSLSHDFSKTQEYLSSMQSSANRVGEVSLGSRIPERKAIHELMENADFESKKTLLALFAKGLVDDNGNSPLYRVFSSDFHDYLSKNISSKDAQEICEQKRNKIKQLQDEYRKQYDVLKNKQRSEDIISSELNPLRSQMNEADKGLITDEEVELLDIYQEAKTAKNIVDLIQGGFLDDTTLETLIRHHKLDGDASLDLAHIMRIDQYGVNPKVRFDGDIGRGQDSHAQTIQGNIALKQRGLIIDNLKNIGQHLQNKNDGIEKANVNLENIGRNILQTNDKIEKGNAYLESIYDEIGESNAYLGDILDTTLQNNSLLIEANELQYEGNELSKITNHLLVAVADQINTTGIQISEVLQEVGQAIVVGFDAALDVLHSIEYINEGIQQVNHEILQELYKQSEILVSIDQRLAKPLDTQANEYFTNGLEMLNVVQRPSKNDRSVALESFENGLKLKNTHVLNLYAAGEALKNIGQDKKAALYLERAYKFSQKTKDASLSKNIAMDLAKIYIQNLQFKIAKHRLDEVISHDSQDMEAYLLKARITIVLKQKKEFETMLDLLYHKIVEEGGLVKFTGNYNDVLKYLYKPVNDLIDQQLQQGMFAKLSTLLLNLQAIGHADAVKSILGTVLFYHPQNFLPNAQNIRNIISTNKEYFVPLYETHINSHFVGGDSKNFFALAYLGRGSIASSLLDRLIDVGLEFDINYILLKQASSLEQKKAHLSKLKEKIYALGDDAKYMLRDYIKTHPHSLLAL